MSTKTTQENCTESNYLSHVLTLTDRISEPARDWIQFLFDKYESNFDRTSAICSEILSLMILTMGCFWLIGSFYTLLDYFQWPKFLYRYKIQDDKQITLDDIIETAKVAFYNQITVQLLTTALGSLIMNNLPFDRNYRVPPVSTIIYHLVVFVFLQEITFYYLHRLLHYKFFYRFIHKIHHKWQAPIAISALYCHPFEHFLANLVPVLIGPFLMLSHRSTISIWLLIVHIVTLNDHSGYHFPLMPSPEFHDYHHLMFNQNFGRMGFLDYFHGTSERYFKSKYSKRHQVLLSLTPMKILIPDND
ncbi:aldo-keto reductase family 1 member b10-like protein 1 [Dermatophagoides farinae]|uniref:Aldo-keto reductase family 1 member b10-like protein 1 n=2 Tax=Dermatophagoides farinae TaxID=6954 RepID=A0A9D4NUF9_DERFA|nr:aldo-keto reductase family 1 member b10-like protein 1 [Dermatophagoides farinae]